MYARDGFTVQQKAANAMLTAEAREDDVQAVAKLLSLWVNFLRNFVTFGATTTWQ